MTTSTCRRGHESATADYCDVCGVPMAYAGAEPDNRVPVTSEPGSAPSVVPALGGSVGADGGGAGQWPDRAAPADVDTPHEPAPARPCPVCGTPQTGRFCEEDGYDFLLAPPVAPAGDPEAGNTSAPPSSREPGGDPTGSGSPGSGPAGSQPAGVDLGPTPAQATGRWQIVVGADRDYYELIRSLGGADAARLEFPRFLVERRFALDRRQLLIGRYSRSRGVHPDIDLSGQPEDPGVSHLHALLVPERDGWALVDLRSANGSYLNDPNTTAIAPNTPVALHPGDRIYLGAWTVLTIRLDA